MKACALLLLLATAASAGTHLSPDDTGWVSPDERGPIGQCEFKTIHALGNVARCLLQCSRPNNNRDPDPAERARKITACGGDCQARYLTQTALIDGCPACMNHSAAAASFSAFAIDLNGLIYADQSPGTTACEGALSTALDNLISCIATAQLQSGIAEIEPNAEQPKRLRCMGSYATSVDRLGPCQGRDPTVTLGYGDYTLSYMKTHSHLSFCAE